MNVPFLYRCLLAFLMLPGVCDGVERVGNGLVVAYDFEKIENTLIKDVSGMGDPIHLKVREKKAVVERNGFVEVKGNALIVSEKPAAKLSERVSRTGEITIEAWIRPANATQEGPARIVTLSKDSRNRSFTLGQEKGIFDVRFQTTKTSSNGMPSVATKKGALKPAITHVVYTRDRSGRARIYLDGKVSVERQVGGMVEGWDRSLRLGLANEMDQKRSWLGEFYLMAIYGRSLREHEVVQNFEAGHAASIVVDESRQELSFFEHKIAPLLAEHCLECHDTSTREGKLDLSKRDATLARANVLKPGDANASELFVRVDLDEMPEDRPPLNDEEKALLKKWIDEGADWPLAELDAALLSHGGEPDKIWLQRLTIPEYIATVKRATGVDVSKEAHDLLPPDVRADGFSNTAYNLGVDLKHVEAYSRLAEIIVSRMKPLEFARRHVKKLNLVDGDDRAEAIAEIGLWLMRGPLEESEILSFGEVARQVRDAKGDDDEMMGYVIEAMLQSPRFMYRIESQRGDGSSLPVGSYELASRLSYIVQGAGPDAELFAAVKKGGLGRKDEVRAQVGRLLKDPLAIDRSVQFIGEWLNLGRLENLAPSPEKFPDWDSALAVDMRVETVEFFKEVVWKENRPLADLLNAKFTHVTPALAAHYNFPKKLDNEGRVSLADVPGRGGLLTHGSILTIGGDEASMVSRGLFVLHDILRGAVKDPPPCVDTTPVPAKAGLTQRGIALERIANNSCGGCHSKFEPLAFGLERFDGLGSYYEKDKFGNELRQDGNVLFPGTPDPVEYETSDELMDILVANERVRESITWKVTQFAMGRPLTIFDAPILGEIHREASENGGTWQATITAIVMSDLVQMTRTEPVESD